MSENLDETNEEYLNYYNQMVRYVEILLKYYPNDSLQKFNDKKLLNEEIQNQYKYFVETDINEFINELVNTIVPITDYDFGFFLTSRYSLKDFRFLDKYNSNIQSIMRQMILGSQSPNTLELDTSAIILAINQLKSIDEVSDIFEIINENQFLQTKDNKTFTQRQLNEISLNCEIEDSMKLNSSKMENLLLDRCHGLDFVKILFVFLHDNTIETLVPYFIFTEEYFVNRLTSMDMKRSFTFNINIECDNDIIFDEMMKYLYTGSINVNISENNIEALYILGNQYQLRLEKICIRIFELNNNYDTNIILEKINLIDNGLFKEYQSYLIKINFQSILIIENDNKLYFITSSFSPTWKKQMLVLPSFKTKKILEANNIIIDIKFAQFIIN